MPARLGHARLGHARLRHARLRALAVGAAAAGALAGCSTDKLLTVSNPSIANPSTLSGTAGLPAYYAGAIGDFAVGYSGNDTYEGLINYGGLLTDEWGSSDTFPTRNETDRRSTQLDNANNADIYRAIQRSRASTEQAAAQYAQFSPASDKRSEVLSLAGFAYVLIGESYCSGVPFSALAPDGSTISSGQPQTSDQIFQIAQAKFDTAITIAAAAKNDSLRYLAYVGRARALMDRGPSQYGAAAAQQVDSVPASFSYVLFASANTGRQNNGIWQFNIQQQRLTAVDKEGTNGLPFLSDSDSRVRYNDTKSPGFDQTRDLVQQLKYPARTSSIPLATGTEALLIQAEAALNAGSATTFISFLQQARTSLGDNVTIVDPGASGTARTDLLFKERAYSLWLTAHRLGDLRRMIKYYGYQANNIFPVGAYSYGGAYGTDVNLPIPVQEQNNPNYTGSCNKAQP